MYHQPLQLLYWLLSNLPFIFTDIRQLSVELLTRLQFSLKSRLYLDLILRS
nr:MAG TPA: hypothetical protein [Caudoviricetes sp.]